MAKCCKLISLICDPDEKIWIFRFSLGVCSTELFNLASSLEYLVSNGGQVLLRGIRLGGSTTKYPPITYNRGNKTLSTRLYLARLTRQVENKRL